MRANSTTSSMKRRVSWKQRLELETQQLLITHQPNKIWMSEHFSAMMIQIEITALYLVPFFFFYSISYLTFLWRWQACLLLVVSRVQVPSTMIFFLSLLASAGCVCCRFFSLFNFSQRRLSSMLLVVVSSVVLPVVVENAQMPVIIFALFPY